MGLRAAVLRTGGTKEAGEVSEIQTTILDSEQDDLVFIDLTVHTP
jgi:hypothetical protein